MGKTINIIIISVMVIALPTAFIIPARENPSKMMEMVTNGNFFEPSIPECQSTPFTASNQISQDSKPYDSFLLVTAKSVGNLPPLDPSNIESFEQYKNFADTMNDGIRILNEGLLGYQIPFLKGTQEEYDKATKTITKYTPMVSSYNNMVSSAKNVNTSDQNSVMCFYTRSAIFSLELALISSAIYSAPAYTLVGTVYRSSGLQTVAFKCASCVSTVLSNANWFVRTTFVEGTVSVIFIILNGIRGLLPTNVLVP